MKCVRYLQLQLTTYKDDPVHIAPISQVILLISPLMLVATYGSAALDEGLRGKILKVHSESVYKSRGISKEYQGWGSYF